MMRVEGAPVTTCRDLLVRARRTLAAAGAATPDLDAQVLLAAAAGVSRTRLFSHLADVPEGGVVARFAEAVARRERGEPVAYITGEREFWSLPFHVSPAVLVPRPETELVVDAVCGVLATRREQGPPLVCDVGTGSGCIAVSVAREVSDARVVATDVSAAALRLARANAARHRVSARVAVVAGDLFAPIRPTVVFDAIAANPPYIADDAALPVECAHEPARALRGGADGLAVVRRLVAEAPARLRAGGVLVMEFGDGQAAEVRRLAGKAGFGAVRLFADLAGLPRVLLATRL